MAGVKGRSGRKGWKEEAESKDILALSFGILNRALSASDEEFSLEKKAELASKFIIKRIPSIDAPIENSPTNRILIYVSRDGEDRKQISASFGTAENPCLTETV